MNNEPVIDGQTLNTILERLMWFEARLDKEGLYVDSNTVWLAREAITQLREALE
jgi:hypothetical protein